MTEASLLLTFSLFAAALGLALGWLLRAKVEIATETDPESELRNLRGKQALYASKIRSLHLELAQMESKLASLKASGVDIGRPIEPVPLDDAAMDARLASIIGSFEEEQAELDGSRDATDELLQDADTDATPAADEFRSILPADLVEERSMSFDESRVGDHSWDGEGDQDIDLSEGGSPGRLVSGDLYKRVAAALANEAGDPGSLDSPPEGAVPDDEASATGLAQEAEPTQEVPARSDAGPDEPDDDAFEITVPEPPATQRPQPTVPTLRVVRDEPDEVEHSTAVDDPGELTDPAGEELMIDLRQPDDLTVIKGIGPKSADLLRERGIDDIERLAGLDDRALDELAAELGSFRNRIVNEDWRGQARELIERRTEVSASGG